MPQPTSPQVGDHVAIPWGLDTVDGTVVATYHTGGVDRVVVEVPGTGIGNEGDRVTVPLPVDEVTGAADVRPVGSWLRGLRYERDVARAVARVIDELEPKVRIEPREPDSDRDITAETPFGTLVIEVKAAESLSERVTGQVAGMAEVLIRPQRVSRAGLR